MKSLSLALAALLLTAGAAFATPTLKGDIVVNKAVVTVGDMFEEAGALAETAIFLAPAPGTTGIVPLADLQRAAAAIGLQNFDNIGYTRVRVARDATIVDAALLDGLIAADLAKRGIISGGITAQSRFDIPNLSLNAEAVDTPATLVSLRYTPGNGGFAARFMIAGIDQPVDLTGAIDLMTSVPRLSTALPAGAILTAANFETATVPLAVADASGYADVSQLVGQELIRAARAGLMLRAADVRSPATVKRNSIVTVLLRSGPMTLTVKGTALGTASAGEPVNVLNTVSRKVLHGIARADGTVEILTALTVAGL